MSPSSLGTPYDRSMLILFNNSMRLGVSIVYLSVVFLLSTSSHVLYWQNPHSGLVRRGMDKLIFELGWEEETWLLLYCIY